MGRRIVHLASLAQLRGDAVANFTARYCLVSRSAHELWGVQAIITCVIALEQKAEAAGGIAPRQYFVFDDDRHGPRLLVEEISEGVVAITLDAIMAPRAEA